VTVPTRLFADIAPDNAMIYAVIKVLIFISGHRTYRFWTVVDYQHVMVITKLRCCINPLVDLSFFGNAEWTHKLKKAGIRPALQRSTGRKPKKKEKK
jgi:hypothetical protein